jgi:putative mycofactocin binding protein MftB
VTGDGCYTLAPGIRVRRETFGLLFYDSRTTHMTFVRSGDLLEVVRDRDAGARLVVRSGGTDGKVERLREVLMKKGLINDTRACI